MHLTDEEILDRGIRAAAVLNNADIVAFTEEMRADLLECISNTEPHETKTRDALYFQVHALRELMYRLDNYRSAGIALVEKHNAADNAAEEEYSD